MGAEIRFWGFGRNGAVDTTKHEVPHDCWRGDLLDVVSAPTRGGEKQYCSTPAEVLKPRKVAEGQSGVTT
jgi:hypothetical protein